MVVVLPTSLCPKSMLLGAFTIDSTPRPWSRTSRVPKLPSKWAEALLPAIEVGVKVTTTWQNMPLSIRPVQLLGTSTSNMAALVPVIVGVPAAINSGAVPVE